MNCPKICDRFPAALILKSETLTPLPWGQASVSPINFQGFRNIRCFLLLRGGADLAISRMNESAKGLI